jgi:hypothetical protein
MTFLSGPTRRPVPLTEHAGDLKFYENGLASAPPFLLRPPLQNARFLPDRYPDPRPVVDGVGKDFLRLAKIIAGIQQAIDFHAVPRPLLDLVEVAVVATSGLLVSSSSLIGV